MIVPRPWARRFEATSDGPQAQMAPNRKERKPFRFHKSQEGPRLGTRGSHLAQFKTRPDFQRLLWTLGPQRVQGGRRPGPPSSPLPKFKPPLTLVARGEWAAPEARARRWLRPASHLSLLPAALTLSPTERAPKRTIHNSGLFLSADPLPSPYSTPFNQPRTQVKQGLRMCPLLLLS